MYSINRQVAVIKASNMVDDILTKAPNLPEALYLKSQILWEGYRDADSPRIKMASRWHTKSPRCQVNSNLVNLDKIREADIILGTPSYGEVGTISNVAATADMGIREFFADKKAVIINADI